MLLQPVREWSEGDDRFKRIRKFLWLPIVVKGKFYWLTTATVVYKLIDDSDVSGFGTPGDWIAVSVDDA